MSLPRIRDGDAESLVRTVSASGQPALSERGVEGARAYIEERASAGPRGPAVDLVTDQEFATESGPVAVRVYRAQTVTPGVGTSLPAVVYFHGGGWVVGSVGASDAFCRRLSHSAGCVVVSVDYPLAPEHPFPAAINSAVAAITWAAENVAFWGGDPQRLVVLGDSAGGNIGTVAVRRLVAAGSRIVKRQILAYPGTSADRVVPDAQGHLSGTSWPLTDDDRTWFLDQYVGADSMRCDPDVAPLLADVTSMPPTTLLLGGCDPLLVEGLAYADHLWSAGVSVDLHVFAGQIHGFLTFDESILSRSREALGSVANAIANA